MHTRLFAVAATMAMVLFALGPGAATVAAQTAGNTTDSLDVSVDQAGNTGPVVTVTDNETAVENASVAVAALDNGTYEGADENYSTDVNGTVTLPEPEETVSVEVTATAGNATGSTTAELLAEAEATDNETADNESEAFGNSVSAFVASLEADNDSAIGQQVATYVTENNPGNAPDHAGPPADGDRRGPPEHAGKGNGADNETDRRGPPEDAGQGDDADNETDRRGPPEDAGQGDDADNGTSVEDDSDTEDDSGDSSGGPPEQARGNAGGN